MILSSNSGPFSVTITNGLDEPVVGPDQGDLDAADGASPSPTRLELEANSTTTRLLEASTDKLGVHNVTISVTDLEGNPLGSSADLPDPGRPGQRGDLADHGRAPWPCCSSRSCCASSGASAAPDLPADDDSDEADRRRRARRPVEADREPEPAAPAR